MIVEVPVSANFIARRSSAPDIRCNIIGGAPVKFRRLCRQNNHKASKVMPSRIRSTSRGIDNHSAIDQARAKPSSCATSLTNTRI